MVGTIKNNFRPIIGKHRSSIVPKKVSKIQTKLMYKKLYNIETKKYLRKLILGDESENLKKQSVIPYFVTEEFYAHSCFESADDFVPKDDYNEYVDYLDYLEWLHD